MAQPTERHILHRALSGGTDVKHIALDYDLSRINHRLYRQSKCYYASISAPNLQQNEVVEIYTLNNHWINQAAYKLAMETYFNSRAHELESVGGNKARWADFRVTPGVLDAGLNYVEPLDPSTYNHSLTAGAESIGEYTYSRMPNTSGVDQGFTWGGQGIATTTHHPFIACWNVLDEYDDRYLTRVTPPTQLGDIPYINSQIIGTAMGGDAQEFDDVIEDGNQAPYNNGVVSNYPFTQRTILGSDAVAGNTFKMTSGIIPIPCGIILLKVTAEGAVNVNIDVKPGDYKGVYAEDWGTPKLMTDKTWKVQ